MAAPVLGGHGGSEQYSSIAELGFSRRTLGQFHSSPGAWRHWGSYPEMLTEHPWLRANSLGTLDLLLETGAGELRTANRPKEQDSADFPNFTFHQLVARNCSCFKFLNVFDEDCGFSSGW